MTADTRSSIRASTQLVRQGRELRMDGVNMPSEPPSSRFPLDSHDPVSLDPYAKVLNKIYIGGLPEMARPEDLQDCFSRLGNIINIEFKTGYGFVEFDNPQSAADAVSKYHEGHFLGAQIKVEISHGGSRPRHVAVTTNPEACYCCGVAGHWARDCAEFDPNLRRRRPRARSRSPLPIRDARDHYDPSSREPPRDYYDRANPTEVSNGRRERERAPPPPPPPPPLADGRERRDDRRDERRYRGDDSARDSRERVETRSMPMSHGRQPYGVPSAPLSSREYYDDLPRQDYRASRAQLNTSYPHPSPPPREAHVSRPPSYGPRYAEPVHPRSSYESRSTTLHAGSARHDDRVPTAPRGRVAERRPEELYPPQARDRSPRRASRRSLSPPRRGPPPPASAHRFHSPPPPRFDHLNRMSSGLTAHGRSEYALSRR